MDTVIIDKPLCFRLHGKSSVVNNHAYGETGLGLMNQVWTTIKKFGVATTGINHWVYLPDDRMFVGVELLSRDVSPDGLELVEFELRRHLRYIHVGPYQALPNTWLALKEMLSAQGETIATPSLEIYGHHCEDVSKLETTILIALEPKHFHD